MTGGDHRKTKKLLEEKKKIRLEEEMEEKRLKTLMDGKKLAPAAPTCASVMPNCNGNAFSAPAGNSVKSATVSPVTAGISKPNVEDPKIELNQLKSLSEYGIDTSFVDYYGNFLSSYFGDVADFG